MHTRCFASFVCACMVSCAGSGAGTTPLDVADVAAEAVAPHDIPVDGPADAALDLENDAVADPGTPPPTCAPDTWGGRAVGVAFLVLVDPARGDRPLPTAVWYPAVGALDGAACDATYEAMIPGDRFPAATVCGTKDAPPDRTGAPWPVVVFSHGSGSLKEGHKYLCEYLASRGFVVVAPDHTGNVGLAESFPADLSMTLTRALDIRFVADELTRRFGAADGLLGGLGDIARMGIAGHSWGGHTTMAIAGLDYNFDDVKAKCDAGEGYDPWYCQVVQDAAALAGVPDPRFKAALALGNDAGHQMAVPECQGAAGITIPYFQMLGDQDAFVDVQQDGWKCFAAEKGPACIVVFQGAGHLGFTDEVDEIGFPTDRLHRVVRAYAAAFFGRYVAGDPTCAAFLSGSDLSAGAGTFTAECRE